MKQLILVLAIVSAFSLKSQTTLEEYNYVVKGYKVQIESGLDMKKGYTLENISKNEVGIRTVEIKKLIKTEGAKSKISAYMVIYQREGLPKEYICIPHPKSEKDVLDAYWKQLWDGNANLNSTEKLQLILYCVSSNLVWI